MLKPGKLPYDVWKQHDDNGNAEHLLSEADREVIDSGNVPRVGGGLACEQCNKPYYDHPSVVGALWATRLCDGRLVKL